MSVLSGIIGGFIVVILISKNIRRMSVSALVTFVLIAALQVGFVLYLLFTKEFPKQ